MVSFFRVAPVDLLGGISRQVATVLMPLPFSIVLLISYLRTISTILMDSPNPETKPNEKHIYPATVKKKKKKKQ